MRPRRAHRQDSNHAEIRAEFERLGCSWMDTYQLGDGRPDGVAGIGGICIGIEIKDPAKPPSKRELTPDEEKFRMNWKGGYRIVESKEQAKEVVEVLLGWHEKLRG